jgi:hypothetical protein
LDFFKENKVVTLVDIFPHFMATEIHSFDFNDYDSESEMMDEITYYPWILSKKILN